MTRSRRRWVLALGVALMLAAPACGGGTGTTTRGSGGVGALTELGRTLPKEVRDAGSLTVGSDIAYAPVDFFKEGTEEVQGIDPDLCQAMVRKFGERFTCRFQNTTFDGLIGALASRRFDVIMSAMSDTKERQQRLDFVDYFNVGTSILVRKGNPAGIRSLDDLCGRTIGVERGTTQQRVGETQRSTCEAGGRALTLLLFEKDTDALQALKADRIVADLNDYPVAVYNARIAGGGNDFQVVGQQIEAGPYGIGVRKADAALRDALQKAMQAIMDDGTYRTVLEKWKVGNGALKTATINAGRA